MGALLSKQSNSLCASLTGQKRCASHDDLGSSPKRSRFQDKDGDALEACIEGPGRASSSRLGLSAAIKRKKRKVALILAYNGSAYYGMQFNAPVATIESELLSALHHCGLTKSDNVEALREVQWNRAARTDKGVSAACQCVSLRMPCEVEGKVDQSLVSLINAKLSTNIRLLGIKRATKSFNARTDCNRRLYEYVFPMEILGKPCGVSTLPDGTEGDLRIARLNEILNRYVGTHCFANFTEGLQGSDDTAKRYMIRVKASEPFRLDNGAHFSCVEIYGQSFVLYQIRKMCGLAFAIYNSIVPPEAMDVALSPCVRFTVPTAPALGLLLSSLEMSSRRLAQFLDEEIASAVDRFKMNHIYSYISREETSTRSLSKWLHNLKKSARYNRERIKMDYERYVVGKAGLEEERRRKLHSQYPVVTSLAEFYGRSSDCAYILDGNEEFAFRALQKEFKDKFGECATSAARVPGRVNLIGEHCDYNTFPVIGVATRQGTTILGVQTNERCVHVAHTEQPALEGGMITTSGQISQASNESHSVACNREWMRYLCWGWSATIDCAFSGKKKSGASGAKVLVHGDLPRAAGLGSSSSLVTAGALMAARLNRRKFERTELAAIAAEGERRGAGTRGGAVDHTIGMCGVGGSCTYVSFSPQLTTLSLSLPFGASFVIVNSKVTAFKGQSDVTRMLYNTRVIECRVASAVLARRLNTHLGKTVSTPGQLYNMARAGSQVSCLRELKDKVASVMPLDEEITVAAAMAETGVGETEMRNRFCHGIDMAGKQLMVGKRIMHVLSESERVERFRELLDASSSAKRGDSGHASMDLQLISELGKILSESHASLRDLYECSCTEVDELVDVCMAQGSVGSRITGAGWGGCVLSLVPSHRLDQFVATLSTARGADAVFVVEPSAGACVLAM